MADEPTKPASPEEQERFKRELADAIRPYANEVARRGAAGEVAILALKPLHADGRAALRAAGWDEKAVLFWMSNGYRKRLAQHSDAVTARWLLRKTIEPRIFVFAGRGTLLLNVGARGYYFEPSSLDSERV